MKLNDFFNYIQVDGYSAIPKYLQITKSVLTAIELGKLKKNDTLPSINEVSYELEISRDTAEKGYKHLKNLGILGSIPGKGYYVLNEDYHQKLKICLMFNKLSNHKKIIYDAFVDAIGEHVAIDFYIYNNDFSLFKELLTTKNEQYSHYVIIPHFIEASVDEYEILNTIPKSKLILMDKMIPGIEGEFGSAYENFEKDIFQALEKALDPLHKYHTLKLIFPEQTYFPEEIKKGFSKFCDQYGFIQKVVNDVAHEPISEGEVFINLMEDDLVTLIERIKMLNFKIGKQVGLISYNETPWKKIILNGITTISTDFQKMGRIAADLILRNSREQVEVPFYLTLRDSL
ncbi:GntR family transcriptional regulator [Pedobacter sp. MC2016-15]|uniref:GntR family transcriptional regulator n=1 Tax=Pedobacter sp. MC2016-15 TaxID=2994473 RepID=UPI002247E343|nr:GntR family transcriptional regulator [Pedobacter sp. MC2016-15]MCX2479817.1 GntR family transcriptional regulator [Pedobacter sp. MC2016-15]